MVLEKALLLHIIRIAGKTGTAQVADANRGYRAKRQYQSSFCGYFPADNPKYSLIVIINDPKGAYYAAWLLVLRSEKLQIGFMPATCKCIMRWKIV